MNEKLSKKCSLIRVDRTCNSIKKVPCGKEVVRHDKIASRAIEIPPVPPMTRNSDRACMEMTVGSSARNTRNQNLATSYPKKSSWFPSLLRSDASSIKHLFSILSHMIPSFAALPTHPLSDYHSDTLTLFHWEQGEKVERHVHIPLSGRVEESQSWRLLLGGAIIKIVLSEDPSNDDVELSIREIDARLVSPSFRCSHVGTLGRTAYPTHILVPFAKVRRYLSSLLFPIHRSGRKLWGSGKILEFIEMEAGSMLTEAPAGMIHSCFADWSW